MKSKIAEKIISETPQEVRDAVRAYGDSVVRKEELRKEYYKMLGMAAPIAKRENPELFDWFYSKLEAQSKTHDYNYSYLKELHTNQAVIISDYQAKLEAKDKEIADLKETVEKLSRRITEKDNEITIYLKQIADLKAKLEAAESKERFEMPDDKTIIDFAILFNDGRLDPEQLSNMVGMCQMILDRLHEHGNVRQKSKQEIIDEQEL